MAGTFDYSTPDASLPIGAVVQSPLNLEKMSAGKWIRLDGRTVNRGTYPLIESDYAAGVFTSTQRTLNAAPVAWNPVADDTNFLLCGAAGTSPLQASADGITWSTSATWGASTNVTQLIKAGSRFILAGTAGDTATTPYVANINQTAANIVAKSNWTATTSGIAATGNWQTLAYSPTLGRTVMVKSTSDTVANGIKYLNDASTAWGSGSGGSLSTAKQIVVWTGDRFLVFCGAVGVLHSSTDGITWTDSGLLISASSAVSDNAGTVVVSGSHVLTGYSDANLTSNSGFFVSKDYGATFSFIQSVAGAFAPLVRYVNNKFITQYGWCSTDGLTWSRGFPALDVLGTAAAAGGSGAAVSQHDITYKAGVYFGHYPSTQYNAFTATEDMSKYRLQTAAEAYDAAGRRSATGSMTVYMRVR